MRHIIHKVQNGFIVKVEPDFTAPRAPGGGDTIESAYVFETFDSLSKWLDSQVGPKSVVPLSTPRAAQAPASPY